MSFGLALIYLAFVIVTLVALCIARWGKTRPLQLQAGLLSPLGSLYIFTTAFLLSNVIFQANNLRTAVTQEVVTLSKLATVLSVLPSEQRVEGRRLLFDYAYSIVHDESITIDQGKRSNVTQVASDRLRDFLSSPAAAPPLNAPNTPENSSYLRKASDFGFDLIDARERRLSLSYHSNPIRLWVAIYVMYFAFACVAYTVHNGLFTVCWLTAILLLSCPVPVVMLYLYSSPLAAGIYDLAAQFAPVLARNF